MLFIINAKGELSLRHFFAFSGLIIIILSFLSCSSTWVNIHASLPDLNHIKDGIYRGEYDLPRTPLKVVLDVTVQNQVLTTIDIVEHSSSPIGRKAENIVYRIIEHQSLDIDVISRATASSKTIKMAVQNALEIQN